MPFQCSICGEESTRICARCTKDACDNHLCEKCLKCSDCCECEVKLAPPIHETVRAALHPESVATPAPELPPEPEQELEPAPPLAEPGPPAEPIAEPEPSAEPAAEPIAPAADPTVADPGGHSQE